MLRSVLAIIVGFVVIFCLVGPTDLLMHSLFPGRFAANGAVSDTTVLALTEIYVFIYAVFGCYLCARIARRRPMLHALILGAMGLVLNVVASSMMWSLYPAWYHIVAILVAMPAAWVGGRIAERQMSARPVTLASAAA